MFGSVSSNVTFPFPRTMSASYICLKKFRMFCLSVCLSVCLSICLCVCPCSYDIYHDPNPAEVQVAQPVLTLFLEAVEKLLGQWPEHPALLQVSSVVYLHTSRLMLELTSFNVFGSFSPS